MHDHDYRTIYCGSCGHEIRVPIYCKNRFCPVCSQNRARRIRTRMSGLLSKTRLLPCENFKAITLHVRNQESLAQMCTFLHKSFRKLRSRALWKRHVSGGCFVVEISGKPGCWHAHIHIICQSSYFPWDVLLNEWRFLVGAGGIYIQRIKNEAILGYLTKYLTKVCSEPGVQHEISDQLKNFRLFNPFGNWYRLLPKYVKKKYPCPICSCHIWIPEFEIEGLRRDIDRCRNKRRSRKKAG